MHRHRHKLLIPACLLIAAAFLHPSRVFARDSVRVAVLPFEVRSSKDLSYLEKKIPRVIEKHLTEDGATVVQIDEPGIDPTGVALRDLRKVGVKSGADYVIWGSMIWLDDKFSLDAGMVESFGKKPPRAFYVEGESIENLSAIVQRLAREFSIKLFKRDKITDIRISGNKRIEADAIMERIRTKPGDLFFAKSLSDDLKSVYAMGYFEDIRILADKTPTGKNVTFMVKEKATLRKITFSGNSEYDDEKLTEECLTLKTGKILNISDINTNIARIEAFYKDKNYHNVRATYRIDMLKDTNQADLEFIIEEGEEIKIVEIKFTGAKAFTKDDLLDEISSSEKGFFTWITESGVLKREDLNQDMARLTAFYQNNGYMRARIGEPRIDFEKDGIHVEFKIEEGERYEIGEVTIEGDLIRSKESLMENLEITEEEHFNREVIRKDITMLEDAYSDEGYAYVNIIPKVEPRDGKADITFRIEQGKQVYFEKIIITGNTETRDKVIRRQLKVYEQELYGGKRLKRSIRNLRRLDYFEDDIKVNTIKGSGDDKMILKIDVAEKSTGMFMFGGGYSSVDQAFVTGSLSQRNLFGLGQTLQFKAQLGETATRYTISFTEPWMFDIPLSAGFDLYNWDRDYDDYDMDKKGGGIRLGYTVRDFTRAYLSYKYEVADIYNITDDASRSIWDLEGENTTSSVSFSLQYDSRDRIFNPTEGSDHSLTVQYAGLGGEIAFTKYLVEAGRYFPLFLGTVGFLHGKGGYVRQNTGGKLPDYERFYLGGMNSVRGFEWQDIHSTDESGDEIGGNKYVQFNVEWLVPLIKDAGVVGVLFYDTGNVYNNSEEIDFANLREAAGFGFRWYSPMGPIRIECGYILDPKENESRSGEWEFTMGGVF